MGESEATKVRSHGAIADLSAEAWDRCANPDPAKFNPFVTHAFLAALETAGCVGRRTGWLPRHLELDDGEGGTAAVMPLYVKSHSRGEYVFDHAFADAYHRAGGRYYPKLQCAVPFTPVPGPRILVPAGPKAETHETLLAHAALLVARRLDASSLHITFPDEGQWTRLAKLGFLQRTDQQYHWQNAGYASFDDFLATLASRKRKSLRKERASLPADIEIEHVTGAALTEAHWDAFFAFYMDTGSRKWGTPYLNRAFFSLLGAAMANHCLLILARRAGRYVAGALHMIGGDCLYGRYWGALEQHPFLHFELCYYQAIDFAIRHGLARAEAGAQGEHKLARGYLPSTTYSLLWFADSGLSAAVENYLAAERREVSQLGELLSAQGPYRKPPPPGRETEGE